MNSYFLLYSSVFTELLSNIKLQFIIIVPLKKLAKNSQISIFFNQTSGNYLQGS